MRGTRSVQLPDVFLGRDAIREGVFSEKQLRGPRVQRVLRGVYTRPGVPLTHQLRSRAAALLLPPSGVITGGSQATLLDVELNRWGDDVEILVPNGGRWTAPVGIAVRRAEVVEQGRTLRGVPLATAERMAFDLTARCELPDAVANLDAVVRGRLVDLTSFRRWVAEVHDPYVVMAREAARLCDPRAESPQESKVRVHLHLADLPVEPRHFVYDRAGQFVARLDLALVAHKVAVEYDGAWHALREQLEKDRHRLRALRELGWEVVHVTASMLRDPAMIVDAVKRAVSRQQVALRAA